MDLESLAEELAEELGWSATGDRLRLVERLDGAGLPTDDATVDRLEYLIEEEVENG